MSEALIVSTLARVFKVVEPYEVFVERLREKLENPVFVVEYDDNVDSKVVEFLQDLASRAQLKSVALPGGELTMAVDWGRDEDKLRERLAFYDVPCMFAEGA